MLVQSGLGLLLLMQVVATRAVDVVDLKDGTRLEGQVLFEDQRMLLLRTGAREREIKVADISNVRSVTRNLAALLDLYSHSTPNSDWQWLGLARFCQQRELLAEAGVCALGALASNPSCQTARELLAQPRGDPASGRRNDRLTSFEHADETRSWTDGWVLTTTHYTLSTNLPLAAAVTTAFDLELFYRTFANLLATPLGMHEVLTPLAVQVHADRASFPEGASGRLAYFDRTGRRILINAAAGLERAPLFHEAAHQLLQNLAPDIPAWVDEGLAEYFSSLCASSGARFKPFTNAIYKHHFAAVAAAENRYPLERLLAMSSGDFLLTKNVDLKYAQAYSLVYFCLHGENGVYRNGFFHWLRGLPQGKTRIADLLDALDVSESKLVTEWLEYVRERAA